MQMWRLLLCRLLELKKMAYSLLRVGSGISVLYADTLPGSVILPCGSCSLKARLLINMDAN
ncbi:hypothetical protein GLYMA_12G141301v4 [Glycine max]|nr:hypothetical protein GLYMA_12G141301v4 [Glycine max]KAH1143110.1 hypothetical protein GYH30_033697 [Glycine max]